MPFCGISFHLKQQQEEKYFGLTCSGFPSIDLTVFVFLSPAGLVYLNPPTPPKKPWWVMETQCTFYCSPHKIFHIFQQCMCLIRCRWWSNRSLLCTSDPILPGLFLLKVERWKHQNIAWLSTSFMTDVKERELCAEALRILLAFGADRNVFEKLRTCQKSMKCCTYCQI